MHSSSAIVALYATDHSMQALAVVIQHFAETSDSLSTDAQLRFCVDQLCTVQTGSM